MSMKEYGYCPKKKGKGENATYTFYKKGEVLYLVSATLPKRLIGYL